MDRIIRLQIERLPEGEYLATSADVQGLVVEAETLPKLLELVPEIVAMLEEVRREKGWDQPVGVPIPDAFELPIVLAA